MRKDSRFKIQDSRNKGFTMIELLVAATILAVLTTIGLTSYRIANQKSRDGKRKADMEQVRAALEIYRTEEGIYPDAANWGAMLSTVGSYISSQDIADPKNDSPYVYSYSTPDSGRTYQVCACLETDSCAVPYCLDNP